METMLGCLRREPPWKTSPPQPLTVWVCRVRERRTDGTSRPLTSSTTPQVACNDDRVHCLHLPSGNVRLTIGSFGGAVGAFHRPAGIAFVHDEVFVCDLHNRASPPPKPLPPVLRGRA